MIDRDALSREEPILTKGVHTVSNDRSSISRGRALLLLHKLASGAHRRVDETGTSCVEPSGALRGQQSTGTHQKLA
jgi:hypothetical protein